LDVIVLVQYNDQP